MSAPQSPPETPPVKERLQLAAPRPLLWAIGILLLVGIGGLLGASIREGDPQAEAGQVSRLLMLEWRTQELSAQPLDLAGEATEAQSSGSQLARLMGDLTQTGDEDPLVRAMLPVVAVAAREDALASSLASGLPTLSADLQIALAALPGEPTPTAAKDGTSPLPLAAAVEKARGAEFGRHYSPYLRDRVRHRLLVRAGMREEASALAERLHEADKTVVSIAVSVLPLGLLALMYGVFWWVSKLLRSAVEHSRSGSALAWLRPTHGLPAAPGYPVDPLVPLLGLSCWLAGHALSGGLIAAVLGSSAGGDEGGFAMLLTTAMGVLLAQLLIQGLSGRMQPLQLSALLGGPLAPTPTLGASVVALQGFAALLPAMGVTVLISAALLGDDTMHPAANQLMQHPEPLEALTIGLSACVMAPLAEELLFRGLLLRSLVPLVGKGRALLLTSVLFALVHVSPDSLLSYTVLGGAFGIVYLWTGNLWASVILHALWNTMTMAVMLLLAWS